MLNGLRKGLPFVRGARTVAFVAIVALVGALAWQPATMFESGTIDAQSSGSDPEPTGSISRITPSASSVTTMVGETISLSVNLIGRQDVRNQNLAKNANISWSASGGNLEVSNDGTSATYSVPDELGTYTVTASAGAECVGDATDCSATFTVYVRRRGATGGDGATPQNPPGEIPVVLSDDNGAQYEVFTPEDGGTFASGNFSVTAPSGVVPSGEYIGVRMADTGNASNAGMSHHRYTLSGNQYTIFVINAARSPVSSYALNATVTVCIPVPDELRTKISEVKMLSKNISGSLTVLSSSVRVAPSLIVCGYTSALASTVAAGVPGKPPPILESTPEPEPVLPVTGGTTPPSLAVIVWALLAGTALVAISAVVITHRRRTET